MDSSYDSPFVIGSSAYLSIIFTVLNIGIDPAYIPILRIPLGTKKIVRKPSECQEVNGKNPFLFCTLPGPIRNGMNRKVSIDFDASTLKTGQKFLTFEGFEVFSQSNGTIEINSNNNFSLTNKY